jgi:hypothetical protein
MENPAPEQPGDPSALAAAGALQSSKDEKDLTTAPPAVVIGAASSTTPRDSSSSIKGITGRVKTQPWFRQLRVVLKKNCILLWRRPITLSVMLLSSVISVILAGLAGPNVNFDQVELTECGTIDDNYFNSLSYDSQWNDTPLSYNDKWRDGLAVAVMSK